jgi:hypothetical protein
MKQTKNLTNYIELKQIDKNITEIAYSTWYKAVDVAYSIYLCFSTDGRYPVTGRRIFPTGGSAFVGFIHMLF